MPHLSRRTATVFTVVLGATVLASCSDIAAPRSAGPPLERSEQALAAARKSDRIKAAIASQEKHHGNLMKVKGVVGTAVGLLPNGDPAVQVLVLDDVPRAIPAMVDSFAVQVRVTGMIVARSNPTLRLRPAPLGYSIGHPAITAGTIGARVTNGTDVFVLSNNHVLANSNGASLGDPEYQPGPYDGGSAADQIATLYAFRTLNFSGGNNTIDAAIARSDALSLGNSTPTDDGYGTPNAAIFGDANSDRTFDDLSAVLGVAVQKYGRTTKLTHGSITGINASVDVCYEVIFIFCTKAAHFVDQLIIGQAGFSDGGDSGSLIVTDNSELKPVALLFAGSSAETIANRIDNVLNYFNVSIDGTGGSPPPPPPPPPDPVTDVAVMSVTAPLSVAQGTTATVAIVMKNVGNQDVGTFSVLLRDETDGFDFAPKYVSALHPGASVTLNVNWSPTTASTLGPHLLVANSQFIDDNAANNSGSTTSTVVEPPPPPPPSVDIHVGNMSGSARRSTNTWSATVEITVHDQNHQPLNGATVTGNWSRPGLNSNTCTTGELGGNGTCIVLFPSLPNSYPSVIYAVSNVTYPNRTYKQILNHDPDGSSNGTGQKVLKP